MAQQSTPGFRFVMPEGVKDKSVSVIEVGPFHEQRRAREINTFLGTSIQNLVRTNAYILVHEPNVADLERLVRGVPFVDRVIHRATVNRPITEEIDIPFDYVLQDMYKLGTSDADGDGSLRQALIALGLPLRQGDQGFRARRYFLKGNLTSRQIEDVSAFLANPDLNTRHIVDKKRYFEGFAVQAPLVTLKPEVVVERFNVSRMTDDELLALNKQHKLAATLEELQQFGQMYQDHTFLQKRNELGLDDRATDVEMNPWFGIRSEHCFHKEFNAFATIEDKVNDQIFERAFRKGFLEKDARGNYTVAQGIFKTFIQIPADNIEEKLKKRGKNWIASKFEDNAGAVYYDENYMFCIKFETHNSPSNREPWQGAKTGLDGVFRDIFGMSRGTFDAIAAFFYYGTGDPAYKGWLPKGVKHPYMILKGATQGVREAGNEMQVPTLGGGLCVDPRLIGKCHVYCGAVGWSPARSPTGDCYVDKRPAVGDLVLVAGQPVGIDGLHGATESSLSASANISLGHVQADFSFIQAKLKGYMLEAARAGLFTAVGDFGAMGLGSASFETARSTGGLEMDVAKHPRKYSGIQPWQIVCSETQDRMLFIVKPENKEELLRRAQLHEVEVTQLGKLTDSGYIHLTYEGDTVALFDIEKLFNKEPRKRMHGVWRGSAASDKLASHGQYSLQKSLNMVISQPDVASKEWFFRQKDSSVKGGTIQGPLIGLEQEVESDATIQKPLDTEGKDYGAIAYALGSSPKLSDIDAYFAAMRSFVDMAGKIIAVGGALPNMQQPSWDAWAVCGNYCQPNSEASTTLTRESGEHNLASLIREGIAVREVQEALNIPVISGKDSMKCTGTYEVDESFNLEQLPADIRRHAIIADKGGKKWIEIHDPHAYLASGAVKIADYRKCVDSALKQTDDLIYVVGTTKDHLGASQYASAIGYHEAGAPLTGGKAPAADLEEFVMVAGGIHKAIDQELVASCSYIHAGGLATALAKSAMAGLKGASIDLRKAYTANNKLTDEDILYSETPGRFIVTIDPTDRDRFESALENVPYSLIGKVQSESLMVTRQNNSTETVYLSEVKQAYQRPLRFDLDFARGGPRD